MKLIQKLIFLILLMLSNFDLYAQGPPPPPPPPGLPIDSGVLFLLAGAVIYGAKKIRN